MVKAEIGKAYHNKKIREEDCSNCEIIREVQKYYLKQTRKAFKEHSTYKECQMIWEEEHNQEDYDRWTTKTTSFWYDHLGELFDIYCDICKWLIGEITYLKHIEELKQAYADYKPLVGEVINGETLWTTIYDPSNMWGYRISDDLTRFRFGLSEEEAESFGENEKSDLDFLIKQSKKFVNILCRICKENKTGAVYNVY